MDRKPKKRKDSAMEKAAMSHWSKCPIKSEYVYLAFIAGWKAHARHANRRRDK